MPDTRSLAPLFKAIAHQDWDGSRSTALEIAAKEESKGNRKAAQILRGALNGLASNGSSGAMHPPQKDNEFLLSRALVRCPDDGPTLEEVALRPAMRKALENILDEWRAATALAAAGLSRRSRLLFYGPPGCGKTISAIALARELGIPAYVVRFNALIGSYLGQTALNLREVFRYAAQTRCVVILDEIDVLGKRRGSQMDVGELDRIVVGLMQELDLAEPKGLIVGASNLSSQLDDALWRRFDLQMEFPKPRASEITSFAQNLAKLHGISITVSLRKKLASVKDYASAERLITDQARRKVVKEHLTDAKRTNKRRT